MPKSKRQKVISLTKTLKKGRNYKTERFDKVQNAFLNHRYTYVIVPHNMRNKEFKRLHEALSSNTKICIGKNKLMVKALLSSGKQNIEHITEQLHGQLGLMFSNENPQDLKQELSELKGQVYARSGNIASETIIVESGPLKRYDELIPGPLEPTLRKLGMPTTLEKGHVILKSPFTICKMGDVLTPNQAHLLKHFYIQLSEFSVELKCCLDNETGVFQDFSIDSNEVNMEEDETEE